MCAASKSSALDARPTPKDPIVSTVTDSPAGPPALRFLSTELPGVVVIEPAVYRDARGFFLESYNRKKYAEAGIDAVFVQDNHSSSVARTLRGLHAQVKRPQGKLVRVIEGEIFDVAVDIRRGSPSFGKWTAVRLSAESFRQIWVPPGFAHGFCVLSERAQVEYKVTELWDPRDEITIAWNDPDLGIDWPLEDPILSAKDSQGTRLRELADSLSHEPGDG